eukprot:g41.t1 g41   contig1:92296-93567(+)
MKEYLIEHLHRGLVEDFPDQDWSKLVITLGGSSQVIGPAETIFTLPTLTPPRRPHSGLTAASSAHLPGAVTPATNVAEPRVSENAGQAGASPPLISTSHVIESPLPTRQQSTLTEDRIREIFRQEIRSAWNPESIAKDAATNALCTLLHRMDYRDRQWQNDFMPKAVEIISRSVISSLDTATRSQYELPTEVDDEHKDPALRARGVVNVFWKTLDPEATGSEDDSAASQDDIYETLQENETAGEQECKTRGDAAEVGPPREHTPSTPQQSGHDITKIFTPGDKSDESFAAGINVTLEESSRLFHATSSTLDDHTSTTDATLVGKTDRDSDYDTMKDYQRRRRHAWDSDSSEEDDVQRRPESPWKNKVGVPLVLEAANRRTRKDVPPPPIHAHNLRCGNIHYLPPSHTQQTLLRPKREIPPSPR